MTIEALTNDTFAHKIFLPTIPVIVDFWAPWCGPCRMYTPILEQLAEEYEGKLQFYSVNADQEWVVNMGNDIINDLTSIPTLKVFKGGVLFKTIVGAKPKAALLKELAEFLSEGPNKPLDTGTLAE